ncbi:MAG TPA: hypothetical protein VFR02_05965, partial [bacterium]|nr:hypothetical protein [bacterium]
MLAALACLLLFELLTRWVRSPAAWLLSLFWVVGAVSYPGALSAKTGLYQLAAGLLVALVLALAQARVEAAGFLFGLGLACHWMTFLALAPGLLLFAWDRRPWEFKRLATSLAFMALGLSLYLYLPLRAAQGPLLDWGHPVSWRDFWFDFTRAQYGGGEGASWGSALAQGWALLKDDLWEWPGFLLAAFAGVWASWRRDRKEARGLAAAWLFWSAALGFFLHLSADRFYLLKGYALAGEALVLVFVGFALRELPPVSRRFWVPALALFWAVLAVLRFATARQTDYTYAYDYTLNSFQEIPKGGLYFARGDSLVFPAWYFQWVEGRRPDLAVVGVDGLPMGWVRRTLARTHPDLHVPES